jgi:hypothetical protein
LGDRLRQRRHSMMLSRSSAAIKGIVPGVVVNVFTTDSFGAVKYVCSNAESLDC